MKKLVWLAGALALAAPMTAQAQDYYGYGDARVGAGVYGDDGYGYGDARVGAGVYYDERYDDGRYDDRRGYDDGYRGGGYRDEGYRDGGDYGGGGYYGGAHYDTRGGGYSCQAVGCTDGYRDRYDDDRHAGPCHPGCGHDGRPYRWSDGGSYTSPDGRYRRTWREGGSYSSSTSAYGGGSAYGGSDGRYGYGQSYRPSPCSSGCGGYGW
jgi:hypothetical protein